MIHIERREEPPYFEERVRRRGLRFLARVPHPSSEQLQARNYWKECAKDLHRLYSGICAYSCHWIAYDTGWRTIEHFLPKVEYPHLAYEWSNYRLVCGVLNGRKSDNGILDPFEIDNGWFVMDFPSLLVRPSPELDDDLYEEVLNTCTIIGLNDEDTCMKSRAKYIENYCKGNCNFQYLKSEAPFIAAELERQNLIERIREIMIY